MRRNGYNFGGVIALLGVGAFYLWRNRFEIQRFLESQGVKTKLDTTNLGNTVRSGISKLQGKVEHGQREMNRDIRQTG